MLEQFEKALKAKLGTIATTKRYLGELADPSKTQISSSELPLIYIDFVEGEPITASLETRVFFNLYIVHISFSKNVTTRANKNYELFDLLADIKNTIQLEQLEGAGPIKIGKMKKLYDASANGGYMTVYTLGIDTQLTL